MGAALPDLLGVVREYDVDEDEEELVPLPDPELDLPDCFSDDKEMLFLLKLDSRVMSYGGDGAESNCEERE